MAKESGYYAVIPASVRYDKKLPMGARLLYGELTALANATGVCWAGNNYFAKLYEVEVRTISGWVTSLIEGGYITSEVDRAGGNKRSISIADPIEKNFNSYRKKVLQNNTINNNIDKSILLNEKAKTLSQHLAKKIYTRLPNLEEKLRKSAEKWAVDIDKLNRIDGYSWQQIKSVIDWCQDDEFWQNNILSGAKLRKQFVQLYAKAGDSGEIEEPSYIQSCRKKVHDPKTPHGERLYYQTEIEKWEAKQG